MKSKLICPLRRISIFRAIIAHYSLVPSGLELPNLPFFYRDSVQSVSIELKLIDSRLESRLFWGTNEVHPVMQTGYGQAFAASGVLKLTKSFKSSSGKSKTSQTTIPDCSVNIFEALRLKRKCQWTFFVDDTILDKKGIATLPRKPIDFYDISEIV